MRLVLKRSTEQSTETLMVVLHAQVDLTPIERAVFDKLNGYGPLLNLTLIRGQQPVGFREAQLVAGVAFKFRDVDVMREAEQKLREFCVDMKQRYEIIHEFQGEEIIDL